MTTTETAHNMTCGTCGCTWNDSETPTPAARCPFEYDHAKKPNVFVLAGQADCASPDSSLSPGGLWLARFPEEARRIVEEGDEGADVDDLRDYLAEVADQMVPIYAGEKWAVFVDLGAWQEYLEDYASEEHDMDHCASLALYLVAERLLSVLVEELVEARDGAA